MNEGRIGQVVGAGVAEPLDIQIPRDQLLAERAERLLVQRDRIAPEVEIADAQLAPRPLDLVDQGLRFPLPELVSLMNGCDAEIARVRAPTARLDDDVRLADHGQPIVGERSRFQAGRGICLNPANMPCPTAGTTVPSARRQTTPGTPFRSARSMPASPVRPPRPPVRRRASRPLAEHAPSNRPARSSACGPKQTSGAPNAAFSFAISATSAASVGVVDGKITSVGVKPARFSSSISDSVGALLRRSDPRGGSECPSRAAARR